MIQQKKNISESQIIVAINESLRLTLNSCQHPALGLTKMPKEEMVQLCKLIISSKIRFLELEDAQEFIYDEIADYYDKKADPVGFLKLTFSTGAIGYSGHYLFQVRVYRNLDILLFQLDGGATGCNAYNQIEVRKIVEKYI